MDREQVGYSLPTDVRRTVDAIAVVRRVPKSKVVEDAIVAHTQALSPEEQRAVAAMTGAARR